MVLAWVLGEILSRSALAQTLVSPGLWNELVRLCGGQVRHRGGQSVAEVPWGPLLGGAGGWVLGTWLIGGLALVLRTRRGLGHALAEFGRWGTAWWLLPGLFALVNIALEMLWPGGDGTPLLYGTLPFWLTAAVAGWGSTWVALSSPLSSPSAGGVGQIGRAHV